MGKRNISIIMPTLNEAHGITATLTRLQALRQAWHEVIVVDGGSTDDTVAHAAPLADRLVTAPRGRACQMNAGAVAATRDVLLFLHADTMLPLDAAAHITAGHNHHWGRFDVRLSGTHPLLRIVESMMNLRSRLTGITTGDQALFVERALFLAVGGFPEQPLMEDIALSRTLKHHGRPLCLRAKVTTSSRRWEQNGVCSTILLMWRLRLAYFLGADPARLARLYHRL
ncbi:MAG: TIGR04283 family arsenosugar biosynthesis glycosyltransferase [Gammaproteobacteria bacterium]|nr:TIGR04283 family arsenosugar biosynthesis glycosyltransferase [Gammaproteobacteria bacterium]